MISRYSHLLDCTAMTNITERHTQEGVRGTLDEGRYSGSRGSYFQTSAELREELTEVGLADHTVYGVEGPGWVAAAARGG